MLTLKLRTLDPSSQRFCDYCGSAKNGPFFATSLDDSRDICRSCIDTAVSLFGINPSKTILERVITMFSAIAKRLLDGDTKKLVQAGLLNGDLSLTTKGEEELLALQLMANKESLVKRADELISEAAEKSK